MTNVIIRAAYFAAVAHSGQFRKYGHSDRPYITHPTRVSGKVSIVVGSTEEMVAAAWLHDVIEDCKQTRESLLEFFPAKVVDLVEELTNPSKKCPELSRAERKEMDRKHIAEISREAKIIKMVDRIDNLTESGDDPETPEDFTKLYRKESRALLEVLRGVEPRLEEELEKLLL